jgi:hypothetical protein
MQYDINSPYRPMMESRRRMYKPFITTTAEMHDMNTTYKHVTREYIMRGRCPWDTPIVNRFLAVLAASTLGGHLSCDDPIKTCCAMIARYSSAMMMFPHVYPLMAGIESKIEVDARGVLSMALYGVDVASTLENEPRVPFSIDTYSPKLVCAEVVLMWAAWLWAKNGYDMIVYESTWRVVLEKLVNLRCPGVSIDSDLYHRCIQSVRDEFGDVPVLATVEGELEDSTVGSIFAQSFYGLGMADMKMIYPNMVTRLVVGRSGRCKDPKILIDGGNHINMWNSLSNAEIRAVLPGIPAANVALALGVKEKDDITLETLRLLMDNGRMTVDTVGFYDLVEEPHGVLDGPKLALEISKRTGEYKWNVFSCKVHYLNTGSRALTDRITFIRSGDWGIEVTRPIAFACSNIAGAAMDRLSIFGADPKWIGVSATEYIFRPAIVSFSKEFLVPLKCVSLDIGS